MNKPIIAMTFSGFIVPSKPWKDAHKRWFEKFSKKLNDLQILDWIEKPNYFDGVNQVMKKAFPKLSDEARTKKARELFFDSVIEGVRENPQPNKDIVNYFSSIKDKFQIASISTNTKEKMDKILKIYKLENFFDIRVNTKENEEDDKKIVFERFIKKLGKPTIYLAGDRKQTFGICKELGINNVFVNFENEKSIAGVKEIKTLEELKKLINNL